MEALLPTHWEDEVKKWIKDDVPSIDIGGLVVGDDMTEATLWGKSAGVVAGVPFVNMVFKEMECEIEWLVKEGSEIEDKKTKVAIVRGPARKILLGERTALNTLSRASGVATAAKKCKDIALNLQWQGHIAGTRKTTPGFRIVEKYALLVAGVATHRLDLSHMVMLKDNHIDAAGSITKACTMAKRAAGFSSKIEVECRSLEDAIEAAKAGADIVMLDNYTPAALKSDAKLLKEQFPYLLIEASGGITISSLPDYVSPHIDVVSMGALTQGYSTIDFSLKVVVKNTTK